MKKSLNIEIEMYCSSVSESVVEERVSEIVCQIKNYINHIKSDEDILNDYLSSDPYKEHKADLCISVKENK